MNDFVILYIIVYILISIYYVINEFMIKIYEIGDKNLNKGNKIEK